MKLSELISDLKEQLDKYGDGTVYTLDDCATREAVYVEPKVEYDYCHDQETPAVEKVEYLIYGAGYSY